MRFNCLVCAAILLLCSCVQNDDYHESLFNEETEIQFKTGDKAVTRAIVTGTAMTQDFKVYGYINSDDDVEAEEGARYIMKDAQYNSDGTPSGGKKYYWPANSTFTANFTAYSPANYLANETNYWNNGVLTIPVDASKMNDDCVDLLIANTSNVTPKLFSSTLNDKKTIRVDTVGLKFHHALAFIQFQAKHENNEAIKYVKIRTISFTSALNTKSTLTINTGANYSSSWGESNTPDTNNNFAGNVELSNEYKKLSDMLIVPQGVPGKVTIVYDIKIQNETGDLITYKNRSITRDINGGEDANTTGKFTTYESGKKYIYRVNISVDELEFNVSVSDWTTGDWWQIWDHDVETEATYSF